MPSRPPHTPLSGERRAAALLVAAAAVVLLSAAWIVGLHLSAARAHGRAERLTVADARLHEVETLLGRPLAARASAPLARRLRDVELQLAAGGDRARASARTSHARAWRLTALTGALALVLVSLLLAAWARLRRTARDGQAAAARAEGERAALQASSRRFHALVQHASEAVLVLDAGGAVTFATPSLNRLLGRADLEGRPLSAFVAPEDAGRLDALIVAARASGAPSHGELALVHRDGRIVDAELRVADRLADADVDGVVLAVRDVSERRRLERQLRRSVRRDPLTGLRNRAGFEERLRAVLDGGVPRAAVLLLDIDDFDTVNDSLGRGGGDQVLATCADRLRAAAGDDAVARLGSDEFVVLLEDVAEAEHAERRARDLAAALSLPARVDGEEVPISVTAGLALCAPGLGPEDLLRCADTALHIAQARGAGQLQAYSPAMHADARRRLELRAALAHALRAGGLDLHYQPIVDLTRDETLVLEALARWTLDGTPIAPAEFIPLAEASGLIAELGAWALQRACADVAPLRSPSGRPLRVSVNVSAAQLRDSGFTAQVATALERSGLAGDRLTLELTESVVMDDVAAVSQAFSALRTLGVRIAIDDFGTGFSSLAALADLPIDALKLDRSFIAAMDGGARDALVAGVISLASRLGLPVVAEGIETPDQLATLRALGCRYGQGFHLGRPAALAVPVAA